MKRQTRTRSNINNAKQMCRNKRVARESIVRNNSSDWVGCLDAKDRMLMSRIYLLLGNVERKKD